MPECQQNAAAPGYQMVCAAIAASPIIYMAVAFGMKFGGVLPASGMGDIPPEQVSIISIVLAAAGIGSTVASVVLKKLILNSQSDDSPAGRFRGVLVAMAVAESGAVVGLVLMLLTGNLLYGSLLCGLSFATLCFHFPGRRWIERGDRPL